MSPPSGACDITGSLDDDMVLKSLSLAKIKTKPDKPSATAAAKGATVNRPVSPQCRSGVSLTPGSGGMDSASLKQALRKLTMAQASDSEMGANVKRRPSSKPPILKAAEDASPAYSASGTTMRLHSPGGLRPGGKENKPVQNQQVPAGDLPGREKPPPPPLLPASVTRTLSSKPTPPAHRPTTSSNIRAMSVSPRLVPSSSTSPRIPTEPSPRAIGRPIARKSRHSDSSPVSTSDHCTTVDHHHPRQTGVSPRLPRPPLQTRNTVSPPGTNGAGTPKLQPHQTPKSVSAPNTSRRKPTTHSYGGCGAGCAVRSARAAEQKSYPLPSPVPVAPARSTINAVRDAKVSAVIKRLIEFPRNFDKGEASQSSKSSLGDYSTSSSTSVSGDSNRSGSGAVVTGRSRPHMAGDVRWVSIRSAELRNGGAIGLTNFKLLKRLGCGDIGTVYLAELCGSGGTLFALKVMDNELLARRKKMIRALTEREILQVLDHPFLPTLYTYFTTDNLSCLVMEYCPGGDLHVLRQKQPGRRFSEASARFYVAEVLLALEYLHMLGVVYRDLKPENILVRGDGHIMLSDFDLSLRCAVSPSLIRPSSSSSSSANAAAIDPARPSGACAGSGCMDPLCLHSSWAHSSCFSPRLISSVTPRTSRNELLRHDHTTTTHGRSQSLLPQVVVEPTEARSNSFVGTHEYLAPEIIKGKGHGSAVDWWTLGVFLYELLYGKTPFKGSGNEETLTNVVSEELMFPDGPPSVSSRARDLIRGLLVKDPQNRLGARRGAAEIKQHAFFQGVNWALVRCATPPEVPKGNDYGSIVAEVLNRKREKAMEVKEDGGEIGDIELF